MKPKNTRINTIDSSKYDREYFENSCDGYNEFFESKGEFLPKRLQRPIDFAQIKEGMNVLDIGSGRGEVSLQCHMRGAMVFSLDYSWDALKIARTNLSNFQKPDSDLHIFIQQSDAKSLPFTNSSFDRVFMLDIVEHLYPDELSIALSEVKRVLRPDGWLIIHTMPNLWYYHLGYPIYRFFEKLRGHKLPANPRQRWKNIEVHVNEQTPVKMKQILTRQGFRSKVWLESANNYLDEPNKIVRFGMFLLTKIYPFHWFFCNDIFAVGKKRDEGRN